MKTKINTTVFSLFLCAVMVAFAQDKVLSVNELPAKAQQFLQQFFSKEKGMTVWMDTEYFFKKEYKVMLKNRSTIAFDSDGKWKEVEMKLGAVPATIVPAPISKHIRKSFPNTFIKEIKRGRRSYDVEISNGLDLEFSKEGKFIRIDD